MIVVKRDKSEVDFDRDKIYNAIYKAMINGSGIIDESIARKISIEIEDGLVKTGFKKVTIRDIENMVYHKLNLYGQELTAKAYEGYRKVREYQRSKNLIDNKINGIVNGTDKDILDENSNKNSYVAPTQRDLIAGEVSRDMTMRTLLPTDIAQAHKDGVIHFHDSDYFVQKITNCLKKDSKIIIKDEYDDIQKISLYELKDLFGISVRDEMDTPYYIHGKVSILSRSGFTPLMAIRIRRPKSNEFFYTFNCKNKDKEFSITTTGDHKFAVMRLYRTYADKCSKEMEYCLKAKDIEKTDKLMCIDDDCKPIICEITSITKTQIEDDEVYDLETGDHYVYVNNVLVHNCCLVNLKDMLENGTVINKKKIETPKSFQTACTIATQIVQQIASAQYGGQTISVSHLAPYVRYSYNKYYEKYKKRVKNAYKKEIDRIIEEQNVPEEIQELFRKVQIESMAKELANERIQEEIEAGVQTIQYQINTFNTSNGQAPFLTIFLYISEEPEYEKETAMIIESILRQRYIGMKNEVGVYITPSFPKLIYVLDENNIHKDSKYRYLTDLACKVVAKRMMPDFISAKIMKQNYDGEVFPPMGCRSFLSNWKDPETGEYKWYGRFNQGVVTLNLVDVALSADKDIDKFWGILEDRLNICYRALIIRHHRLHDTPTSVSPIHWQHGGISRLSKDDTITDLLHNGYSTISLGYAGLYECVLALIGKSHTTEEGKELGLQIMTKLKETCDKWKKETGIGFGLYGTPLESTTYKFAEKLKERFGVIEGITDKNYITNSYHVNVKEKISGFDKLEFESQFQKLSSGGAVSYIEIPNLQKNLEVIHEIVEFIYDHIQYAELNTKSDYCHVCGFEGEILTDENLEWYCPNCGNRDHDKMNVSRRTCGYLGDNFWNLGRTEDIHDRVLHFDNEDVE